MGVVVINSVHRSDFAIVLTDAGSTHLIRPLIQDIGSDSEANASLFF
jgi:hypothetical protein